MSLTFRARSRGRRLAILLALALPATLAACGDDDNGGGGGQSVELRFASYLDKSDANMQAAEWWMDEIEEKSDGRITFKTYYNESLIPAAETLGAVASKRVDVAFTGSFYHAAEWPLTTVASLPLVTENGPAQSEALLDLYESNEAYKQEWHKSGVHLLWPGPLGEAIIGTAEPISSPADLKGKSVRAGGLSAEVLGDLGVNAITVPSTEIYESLDRGLIEAYASIPMNQVPLYGLDEVSTNVYGGWYGAYANGPIIMNLDVYEGLDDDLKKIVDEASAQGVRKSTDFIQESEKAACDDLKAAGVEVESFDAAVKEELQPLADTYASEWIKAREGEGLPGQDFYDAYLEALGATEGDYSDYAAATAACAGS